MTLKVSVLMSAYNEEEKVASTIESVLNQSLTDFEYVIVNDGSKDLTWEILEKYAKSDPRIKLINNEKNIGLTASLNKGIRSCSGQYIARLDAGDICHPKRLQVQSEFLDKNPDVYIVGCFHRWIDKNGKVLSEYTFPTQSKQILSHVFGFGAVAAHPCIMLRESLLDSIGVYDLKHISLEYDLYMRTLVAGYSMTNVPEYLLDVLRRGEGMSISRNKEIFADMFRIRLKYLPKMFSLRNTAYTAMSFVLIFVPGNVLRKAITSPLWSKKLRKVFLKG